jgi:lysophospholipase L1-like esterase
MLRIIYFLLLFMISSTATSQPALNILFLGDSYTIGEAVAENERWPEQLKAALVEENVKINYDTIIAKTGWTTDELAEAISLSNLQQKYDLVTLCIGVNNQYRGRSLENYIDEFEGLLKQAINFAGGDASRVIVLSIPDYGVTPFAKEKNPDKISKELFAYNQKNLQITRHYQAGYADITSISLLAKEDLSLLAEDQLHPSGEMYRRWVMAMMPLVKMILKI